MSYETFFLVALAETIIIETSVLFVVLRRLLRIPQTVLSNGRLLFAGVFASLTTLPYLWFIFPSFIPERTLFIITGEIAVTLVEALFYNFTLDLGCKRSLLLSILCNFMSFTIGVLLL